MKKKEKLLIKGKQETENIYLLQLECFRRDIRRKRLVDILSVEAESQKLAKKLTGLLNKSTQFTASRCFSFVVYLLLLVFHFCVYYEIQMNERGQ